MTALGMSGLTYQDALASIQDYDTDDIVNFRPLLFSILFIVYEVILTRRTRSSRILKKRKELLDALEDARLRKAQSEGSDLGPVAKAELERKERRANKRKRI